MSSGCHWRTRLFTVASLTPSAGGAGAVEPEAGRRLALAAVVRVTCVAATEDTAVTDTRLNSGGVDVRTLAATTLGGAESGTMAGGVEGAVEFACTVAWWGGATGAATAGVAGPAGAAGPVAATVVAGAAAGAVADADGTASWCTAAT